MVRCVYRVHERRPAVGSESVLAVALPAVGDEERVAGAERRRSRGEHIWEARRRLSEMRKHVRIPAFQSWIDYLSTWLENRSLDMVVRLSALQALKIQQDPEAIFLEGWLLCDAGDHARGLGYLQRAIAKGYFVSPTLAGRAQFDALGDDPVFASLVADADAGRQRALDAFRKAGGEKLLGT